MNNRIALTLVLTVLASAPALSPAYAAELEKTDLFVAGEGGYAVYRIPGIIAAGDTLLAYCEARKHGGADWGAIDVVMRRSTDGGKSWEPQRKVATPPGDAEQNPASHGRKPGELTVNNPVAIAGGDGRTVHFLYCVEYNRCFYTRSDDAGLTFADPVEITQTFDRFRPAYDWKVLATGPGHGVRLSNGRLLVPVWLSTSTGGPHRPSRVATIYSDDDGRTWHAGELVPTPELVNPSETAAVELPGGRVMLNIRHEGEPHQRAVVVGPDGAGGWGEVRFDPALPEPVCMGSLVGLGDGAILFVNPHNPSGRERKNLTVKLSADAGATWPAARTVEAGPSAYSDLAVTRDGTILCLYERRKGLTLARFSRAWLSDREGDAP